MNIVKDIVEPILGVKCGQKERDLAILRKHANTFAVMILANLPEDYESRKRIITNGIVSALTQATPLDYRETAAPEMLEILETVVAELMEYSDEHDGQYAINATTQAQALQILRKARGE